MYLSETSSQTCPYPSKDQCFNAFHQKEAFCKISGKKKVEISSKIHHLWEKFLYHEDDYSFQSIASMVLLGIGLK